MEYTICTIRITKMKLCNYLIYFSQNCETYFPETGIGQWRQIRAALPLHSAPVLSPLTNSVPRSCHFAFLHIHHSNLSLIKQPKVTCHRHHFGCQIWMPILACPLSSVKLMSAMLEQIGQVTVKPFHLLPVRILSRHKIEGSVRDILAFQSAFHRLVRVLADFHRPDAPV